MKLPTGPGSGIDERSLNAHGAAYVFIAFLVCIQIAGSASVAIARRVQRRADRART